MYSKLITSEVYKRLTVWDKFRYLATATDDKGYVYDLQVLRYASMPSKTKIKVV